MKNQSNRELWAGDLQNKVKRRFRAPDSNQTQGIVKSFLEGQGTEGPSLVQLGWLGPGLLVKRALISAG